MPHHIVADINQITKILQRTRNLTKKSKRINGTFFKMGKQLKTMLCLKEESATLIFEAF